MPCCAPIRKSAPTTRRFDVELPRRFLKLRTKWMSRIDAENPHLLGVKGKLLKGKDQAAGLRMPFDICVELSGEEIAFDHVALKLGHVDAVGGKSAEGLIERCRNIAYP